MARNYTVVGLLLLAALLLSACQPVVAQTQAPPSDEEVTAAVDAIWDEYEASQMASDPDRWIALWTDDGVKMPPDTPALEGKEPIYARVQRGMTNAPTDEMVITALETQSAGDWAYSRGNFTVTYTIAETGVQEMMDGKFMTILQRQPDGTWKIHRDIHNSNVPPAPIAAPAADPAEVANAVNAIWDEYEASVIAGDAERWIAQWTEGGVQMPPDEPFVEGMDSILARVGMVMQAAPVDEFVITPLETQSFGDLAFSRGVYTVNYTVAATGEPGVIDGKFMTILQRQPDGSWKIHRDIFNSNVPPAPVAAPATDPAEVAAAVDAIWREYEASLLAGDVDRWIAQWMEDGVQMPPDMPPRVGKETIYAAVSGFLSQYEYTDFVIDNEDAVAVGDLAFARGTYAATFAAKGGGDPVSVEGKYMTILRRQPDGSWKIYRDIFNSNVP